MQQEKQENFKNRGKAEKHKTRRREEGGGKGGAVAAATSASEAVLKQELSHFNPEGRAHMVAVGDKASTERKARAIASVWMNESSFQRLIHGDVKKGDVLAVSQIAGIMAAKKTSELIPMCHPLMLSSVDIRFASDEAEKRLDIIATVSCSGKTGVEMEALTAVSVAALTVYDMCKAIQKDMLIGGIRLLEKSGGKSGDYFYEKAGEEGQG